MSRLDSVIRRLTAQRACLDLAVALIEAVPGAVIELGLGNGRTFDHLREHLPGREIFVFERSVAAHPGCIPDPDHLVLGDFRETLPRAAGRIPGAALVHADFGSGDSVATTDLARFVAAIIGGLLAAGGIVASDQPLATARLQPLPLPEGVQPGRYFLYRAV